MDVSEQTVIMNDNLEESLMDTHNDDGMQVEDEHAANDVDVGDDDSEDAAMILIDKQALWSALVMVHIYGDLKHDYYIATDWSPAFYTLQAMRGFIAVGHTISQSPLTLGTDILLPQIQRTYCVLDWERMRNACRKTIFKQIRKTLPSNTETTDGGPNPRFTLRVNCAFDDVIKGIQEYHGEKAWLCPAYVHVIQDLFKKGTIIVPHPRISKGETHEKLLQPTFRMCSIELYDHEDKLVAGELGYITGAVFTSLTGFCKRMKKFALGKMQIVSLGLLLEKHGFEFLNLGCPPSPEYEGMQYKAEIGGIEIPRDVFLSKWDHAIDSSNIIDIDSFCATSCCISDLV